MEWRRKAGGDKNKEICDNFHEVHSGTRSKLVLTGIFRFELVIYNIVSIAGNGRLFDPKSSTLMLCDVQATGRSFVPGNSFEILVP